LAKRTDNNYKQHKIIIITKTNTHTENPSVNFSHFHLLWNLLTDINQTWQGCWGEGPLQSIYISLWFDEIHGHQRRSSILIGRFSKMFSYELTMQNNLKLCRNVLCEVFYKRSIFGFYNEAFFSWKITTQYDLHRFNDAGNSIVTRWTLECLACQHIDVFLFNEFIQISGQGHMAYDRLTCTPNKVSSYQILII
jgi:hypothetical protein